LDKLSHSVDEEITSSLVLDRLNDFREIFLKLLINFDFSISHLTVNLLLQSLQNPIVPDNIGDQLETLLVGFHVGD